jgi:hypothetical protein
LPQRVTQELQAAPARRAFQTRIEDKAREHFLVVGRRGQRRVIA